MDEKVRAKFKKEFNTVVGELLKSLRNECGMSLAEVAEVLAKTRLEKVKRLEAGEESLHGSDLIELVQLYGVDFAEVSISIQRIAEKARSKYPTPSRSPLGAPQDSPPNAP